MLLLLACAEAPQSACPGWSGLGTETRVWTYSPFGEGETYTLTATPTAFDQFVLTGPEHDATLTCDADGLWLLDEHRLTEDLESWRTYEPPALLMPATVSAGSAWSFGASYTYRDSNGVAETRSDDLQFAAVGTVQQHVTAGGFETLEVQVIDGLEGDTRYYADGIGLVLDGSAQLVSVD